MKQLIMAAGLAILVSASGASDKKVGTQGNPFLSDYTTPYGVPPFEEIKMEHYKPAFLQGMEEEVKEIEAICNNPEEPTFENTIVAMDQSGKLLNKVRIVFGGQSGANTNAEMEALSREMSPLFSKHGDDIRLNPVLFARVKAVYDKKEGLGLNKEEAKLLEETYKSFVRGGANLSAEDQAKLRELNSEIAMLQLKFGQNMLKETVDFKLVIEKEEDLSGLPESLIANAAEAAKADSLEGWLFTLHNPSVMPFLQYADNRDLREKIFKGYIMRGNNNNEADNKQIVRELVAKRLEKSHLLGYDTYAAFALEDRMAKKAENVYDLLNELWAPALLKAKEELADIQIEIRKEGKSFEAEAWDWRYYFEKAKKAKFNLDENQIRPYLKLENVRDGAFYVANKLYGITFSELKEMPLSHPEAQVFACKDKDGTLLGLLYMDFFPRASKRGGAWCGAYRSQTYENGKRVVPIVTNVCNFSQPAPGQPALLSADEAETLFHEFGHALHSLFRDVHYYGIAGVPRDFVELPSQIMEHWVFEPEVLKVYAKHYETGEVIPADLIEKLDKSGKYGQGFATVEYLAASLLDMDFHVLKDVPADFDVVAFENKVLGDRGLLKQIPPRYRSTYFNHTMGGGYTAGYYSYIWAEVLDADAYQAFTETGDIFDPQTATKFRNYVLTPGGIDDAMDMYIHFRGKEPNTEALLKNRGLK
ncbi:M3 family peptidase [Parabacteroides sp. 52]|uniref:M3 family metallopeptidase n=1 Tax=unclassified Parabacteroides TaxID=2649774 RepID=UPI0013D8CDCB|nr:MULTISPECIES: M3 family metallopeptidase [unclassified Parabacteroides]MDH6534472.1 peptidyl-dipeptidase Dcp [Parabacteroides sp. PM5-20]NDV55078.1 M3 family peptidase [Parabacteroides sp. 52]